MTTLIGQALPAKIVRVDGATNLFRVAARELGDALQAWRIAELNGVSDYWAVPAATELLIPQPTTDNNGGLPYSGA